MIKVTEIQVYDNGSGSLITREKVCMEFADQADMEQARKRIRKELNEQSPDGHHRSVYFTFKEIPV